MHSSVVCYLNRAQFFLQHSSAPSFWDNLTRKSDLAAEEAEKLVIERSDPVFPQIAKGVGAKGLVRVEAIVSEEGQVTSAKAISGHPLLQTSSSKRRETAEV